MSQGGLALVLIILLLLNLLFGVYLVKYKLASPDPHKSDITKVDLDLKRSAAGMEEYERQVIMDLLRDQLKYSQEDYSELQGEMKALRVQVAKLENNMGATNNRLDNYRYLLSQIEENTRK